MPASSGASRRPEYNIRAIEAAVAKPYAEGVLDERRLFMELMSGTQAQGAAIFLLRRAQGRQDRRRPRRHRSRATIKRVGVIGAGTMGGGISMNFLSRRHPGDDRRDGAGRARPRHRRDAQELRGERGQGPDDRRRRSRARWALLKPTLEPRRPRRLRPDHRGGVREYGREEGDFRQARQDRQAGRDPRLQHLLPQRRRDRGQRRRGRRTWSACTSSRPPT